MDCTNWFYLCLTLCGVILAMLAMFFNYSLKLDWRTAKLEKKNGKEMQSITELLNKSEYKQKQIDELKKEVESLRETSQRLKAKSSKGF